MNSTSPTGIGVMIGQGKGVNGISWFIPSFVCFPFNLYLDSIYVRRHRRKAALADVLTCTLSFGKFLGHTVHHKR